MLKKAIAAINPKLLASIEFWHTFGRPLNWNAPRDLNEKINWLKFCSDTYLWTRLADKYAVRDYVEECGYADNLVKLYGKWDRAEDIDWDVLPDQFVMKVNNGSGDVMVCKEKEKLDKKKTVRYFSGLLNKTFGYYNGEPHYSAMKPVVIAEELLDCNKQPIDTDTLIDYKIWCFNGKPYYIWTCYNRHEGSVEVATYDLEWNRHDEKSIFTEHYVKAKINIPKPRSLSKMLEMAGSLSAGFPQVRVDLYEVDGKPYFGEMTFTSAGGYNNFYTQDFLNELGDYTDLNLVRKSDR